MVYTLGHEGGVKDDAVQHFLFACTLVGTGKGGKLSVKEGFGKLGDELVHRVVVMNAVTKPYLLQVFFKSQVILVGFAALIVGIDVLKGLANHQVVLAVLVKQDVAAIERGLGEVIDQLLLLEREFFKARHLVAEHLDVGKAVNIVVKAAVLCHSCSC